MKPNRAPADLEAPPDHPAHVPAGDPERRWRRRRRWLNAPGPAKPSLEALRGNDAVANLDDLAACADWLRMAPCPRVAAMGLRFVEVVEAVRDAKTDDDRRAFNVGRALGIQPPAGKSAGYALALDERNRLLRHLWQAVPAWRDLAPRAASAEIVAAFERYRAGRWQDDKTRKSAPITAEPIPTFWRLARLRLAVVMPRPDSLARLLEK